MSKKILIALGFAAAAFGASAQVTGNVTVSASVSAACRVTTTSAMAFGVYSPLSGAATDASGSVSVACVKGSVPVLGLNTGANASGSQRRMTVGGNFPGLRRLPADQQRRRRHLRVHDGLDHRPDRHRRTQHRRPQVQHLRPHPGQRGRPRRQLPDTLVVTVTF
ncbi:spore coat protein U domain-containing protein [Ramlibacter terrae]|uniref:Spore coat protein U domain-containing protein n=1 Tax=Ramlibacter terrae TaxID=2732511 RepID=A0ABX6P2T5_9BURK|nr:spore coat protein U domain-containing protein [Ramlibacter terrae]